MHRAEHDARAAFLRACALDVETPKPGNVSLASAGHGMTAAQFIASADAAAGALFAPGASVGERILNAMTRTLAVAGCNTNLGIVLLCAPLAVAREHCAAPVSARAWQAATQNVLAQLDIDDARAAYRAIALANPGGLGDAPEQPVQSEPTIDLRAAMSLAADRDSIARQYANGFRDIFATGLTAFAAAPDENPQSITLNVFLSFLGAWPDSHIVRKQGVTMAQSVTADARRHHTAWRAAPDAQTLAAWDADLKARGINPGTSADLTVATLFAGGYIEPARTGIAAMQHGHWHGS